MIVLVIIVPVSMCPGIPRAYTSCITGTTAVKHTLVAINTNTADTLERIDVHLALSGGGLLCLAAVRSLSLL